MTDLHCHILPGMDDGAKDIEASLGLLLMEKENGVDRIVFTPHYLCEKEGIASFLKRRDTSFNLLAEAWEKAGDKEKLSFSLGAEVKYSPALTEQGVKGGSLRDLCFTGTSYMLLELPLTQKPAFLKEVVYDLQTEGITPVIAHVERCPYLLDDLTELNELAEMGLVIQTNANTVSAGDKVSAQMLKLIKWELVHVVSTDAHSLHRRPARLKAAYDVIANKLGEDILKKVSENGDRVFFGEDIITDSLHEPKKLLGRWI